MARKVNLTTATLRLWWSEFNRTYFNGELNAPNYFELTNSTRALGQFSFKGDFFNRTMTIRISVYYDRDERGFKETLLHEMIHQWQCFHHLPIDHKANFKRKADQINRMGGWNIKRTTSIDCGVADGIKERKTAKGSARKSAGVYLVKFTRNGNTPAFAFATKTLGKRILTEKRITEHLKTNPYYGNDMEIYYIDEKPDNCRQFIVNRANLKNYNYATYSKTIDSVIRTAQKVKF